MAQVARHAGAAVGIEESARHNLFGINILRKFLKKREKGLDRFGKLAIFTRCGKVEEGGDCIQEESARVAAMLIASKFAQYKSEDSNAGLRVYLRADVSFFSLFRSP